MWSLKKARLAKKHFLKNSPQLELKFHSLLPDMGNYHKPQQAWQGVKLTLFVCFIQGVGTLTILHLVCKVFPDWSSKSNPNIYKINLIAGATVLAKDVATGEVPTLGGETIGLIKTRRGGVKVVGPTTTVNVVKANVLASNGVIHVVDNVIL